jgi:hypothetical protein
MVPQPLQAEAEKIGLNTYRHHGSGWTLRLGRQGFSPGVPKTSTRGFATLFHKF